MIVKFTAEERSMINDVYSAIADDPSRGMTQQEAGVITSILNRNDNTHTVTELVSIKHVLKAIVENISTKDRKEFSKSVALMNNIIKKVSSKVK